jgi:pimeloyl-ACP methyl ester carboxylesterase
MMGCCQRRWSVVVILLITFLRWNGGSALSAPKFKDQRINLPNGISAQVVSGVPSPSTNNSNDNQQTQLPILVFLHGSFHSSWCWEEKFFPYFVSLGYPVVAFSWRGTSGTPAGEGVKKVKAAEHCQDLQGFLDQLPAIVGPTYTTGALKPILISHSFGGIVVMKYLETCGKKPIDLFEGLIHMCSVPPSGNGKLTLRYLKRSLRDSWKITAGFAMKKCIDDAKLTRELFFGGPPRVLADGTVDDLGVSDADIHLYQQRFARDTVATIDLLDLGKQLPSFKTDKEGKAPFVSNLPPCLVIGANDDFIVDEVANMETANYFGLDRPVFVDSPHDVMLGRTWKNSADTIHEWIQESIKAGKRRS